GNFCSIVRSSNKFPFWDDDTVTLKDDLHIVCRRRTISFSLFTVQIVINKMAFQIKPEIYSNAALSEPHQWLERAIQETNIKYFDYSHFKDFKFLGFGGFGRVEKAIYDFAGTQIPYA